ncbi:hypothetical protein EGR_08910 [Echinococcus granulosus]|uniref:Uncharacterized protein n=1 Tax=Echinococcus granulosus TaxID=6210 RepID=W6U501_ECHGR|nr:hypothetical protein EGR_08910 [Echinococcus granulosus]EUB56248.1 hypothetical protein EGR_08910 [Echinococcus granulosus]
MSFYRKTQTLNKRNLLRRFKNQHKTKQIQTYLNIKKKRCLSKIFARCTSFLPHKNAATIVTIAPKAMVKYYSHYLRAHNSTFRGQIDHTVKQRKGDKRKGINFEHSTGFIRLNFPPFLLLRYLRTLTDSVSDAHLQSFLNHSTKKRKIKVYCKVVEHQSRNYEISYNRLQIMVRINAFKLWKITGSQQHTFSLPTTQHVNIFWTSLSRRHKMTRAYSNNFHLEEKSAKIFIQYAAQAAKVTSKTTNSSYTNIIKSQMVNKILLDPPGCKMAQPDDLTLVEHLCRSDYNCTLIGPLHKSLTILLNFNCKSKSKRLLGKNMMGWQNQWSRIYLKHVSLESLSYIRDQ